MRAGSAAYFVAEPGAGVARMRLPEGSPLTSMAYRRPFRLGDVEISLHPAGHILGSSQVRVAHSGQVWVVSGDYKRQADPTCEAFEPVACDVFISEATFALPAYRWPSPELVVREIYDWWQVNRSRGMASVLFAYALGKAQRVLAELMAYTHESVFVHGAVATLTDAYRAAGVAMLATIPVAGDARDYAGALIVAPPSAAGSPWMRRFGDCSTGFCSGWMRVRGDQRRRGYDRGFVLSDHADWPALLRTCRESGARRILLTHGHSDSLGRYLHELGIEAAALPTEYGAEE